MAKTHCQPQEIVLSNHQQGIECIGIKIQPVPGRTIFVFVIYRQEKAISPVQFTLAIQTLLGNFFSEEVVILGDFNQEAGQSITQGFMKSGFAQLILKPTTDNGTTIDHIYTKFQTDVELQTEVINTYYSDHDITSLIVKL